MSLTDKQQRFVNEYVIDSNAKQAAIRAGYSERTAEQQGSRLLSNVKVAAEVRRCQREVAEKIEVTAQDVIGKLWGEATWFGDGSSHAARVSALSWLGKYHSLFTEKVAHEGDFPMILVRKGEDA